MTNRIPPVEFGMTGDGNLLRSSGVLTGGGELKSCDVELTGVKRLDLVVDTTPVGYNDDHVAANCWC